jgi:sortase A
MARQRWVDRLSTEELRDLLVQKRRTERRSRLEEYRRSGRVVPVGPEPAPTSIDSMRSSPITEPAEIQAAPRKPRTWMDKALLLVEVGAVVCLLFVVYNIFTVLGDLNKQAASDQKQPTLTPTPLIMAVILPSGHTPPNAPGGVQPNDSEIPEHLRPLVKSLAALPLPTASPEQAVRIQIPVITVDAPVVQGDGWEQLKKGVGQHSGSANPGQKGNVVLSAHNDVFGQIFRDLDKLKNGDKITLFTNQRTYTYIVTQIQVIDPTRVDVIYPTQNAVATLVSCYPYMVDNKRIVVSAHLQEQ